MTELEKIITESTLGQYAKNKEWCEELAQAITDAGCFAPKDSIENLVKELSHERDSSDKWR